MNRLDGLFQRKKQGVLNIYCTAGFPNLTDTLPLIQAIAEAGADIIEVGIPFSDPVADGETIQKANTRALANGMNVSLLFEQLKPLRQSVQIPVILMGDINPVIQYGVERFCASCVEVGIDGLILPNLPMEEYLSSFKAVFERYGLYNIFLITPQTSEERIRQIDENSSGFIYMVSASSTTGSTQGITVEMKSYFERIASLTLKNPRLIGFGIKDKTTFDTAAQFANGAIIGSAFIRAIEDTAEPLAAAKTFIQAIRG